MESGKVFDYIRERIEDGRGRQYGEAPVSEYAHALQCAPLAEQDGADEELVVAALLHDFGRLVAEDDELSDAVEHNADDGVKRRDHGEVGAHALEPYFWIACCSASVNMPSRSGICARRSRRIATASLPARSPRSKSRAD